MANHKKARRRTVACGACVWRKKQGMIQILLIKPTKSYDWGFPKGHLEPGESLTDCAHREIWEETGILVFLLEKLPVITTVNKKEIKEVHLWLAIQRGVEDPWPMDPDGEVETATWHDIDSLPSVHKYQRDLLAQIVTNLKTRLSTKDD